MDNPNYTLTPQLPFYFTGDCSIIRRYVGGQRNEIAFRIQVPDFNLAVYGLGKLNRKADASRSRHTF